MSSDNLKLVDNLSESKLLETSEENIDYSINKLNLLAFPKNSLPICELTGARANVELVTKYYTLYYASSQLAIEAWESIIHKIIVSSVLLYFRSCHIMNILCICLLTQFYYSLHLLIFYLLIHILL